MVIVEMWGCFGIFIFCFDLIDVVMVVVVKEYVGVV